MHKKATHFEKALSDGMEPGSTVSLPLGAGFAGFLGQSCVPALCASDYFPHVRVMERVTIAGDKPYFDAEPKQENAFTRVAANL